MPEYPELAELRAAWAGQPGEESPPVDVERLHERRTSELFSTTRSEVIGSVAAALLLAGVVTWRFGPEQDRLVQAGCAGVVVWAAVTVFRFRNSLRRDHTGGGPGDFARTGLEHYRSELLRRRDHLRSAWLWHGPLCMAGILAAVTLPGRATPGRLVAVLPVILLLAGWAAAGIWNRLRQAGRLEREIEEIDEVPVKEVG